MRAIVPLLATLTMLLTACGGGGGGETASTAASASGATASPSPTANLDKAKQAFIAAVSTAGHALFSFQQATAAGTLSVGQVMTQAQPVIAALQNCEAALQAGSWPPEVAADIAKLTSDTHKLIDDFQALATSKPYGPDSSLSRDQRFFERDRHSVATFLGLPGL